MTEATFKRQSESKTSMQSNLTVFSLTLPQIQTYTPRWFHSNPRIADVCGQRVFCVQSMAFQCLPNCPRASALHAPRHRRKRRQPVDGLSGGCLIGGRAESISLDAILHLGLLARNTELVEALRGGNSASGRTRRHSSLAPPTE